MICGCERQVAACLLWFQKEHTMWPCVCVCVNRKACLCPSLAALYDLCMYVSSRGCMYAICASHLSHGDTARGAAMTPERTESADLHQAAAAMYWTCVLDEAPVFTLDYVSLRVECVSKPKFFSENITAIEKKQFQLFLWSLHADKVTQGLRNPNLHLNFSSFLQHILKPKESYDWHDSWNETYERWTVRPSSPRVNNGK